MALDCNSEPPTGIGAIATDRRTAGERVVPSPRVLVADDDGTSRLLVAAALDDCGVVEAEHGLAAVEQLERSRFDLAILDLDMPVMDGFSVIERVRERAETMHLPIIVVTGRDDVIAIERAFALGATSFICKPLNWNVFRHQVRYVLQVAGAESRARVARDQAQRLASARERGLAVLENEIGDAVTKLSFLSGKGPEASLAEIFATAERLLTALGRVRWASSILAGRHRIVPESIAAFDLAQDAVRVTGALLGGDIASRVVVEGDPGVAVLCDRALAIAALREVLHNALVASPADQPVILRIVQRPSDKVRFELEDHGAGMPSAVVEALDGEGPVQRPGRKAPGLGIAAARAIAEAHGGHFAILSEPGRGTEVFLSFPAASDGEESVSKIARIYPSGLPKSADLPAN